MVCVRYKDHGLLSNYIQANSLICHSTANPFMPNSPTIISDFACFAHQSISLLTHSSLGHKLDNLCPEEVLSTLSWEHLLDRLHAVDLPTSYAHAWLSDKPFKQVCDRHLLKDIASHRLDTQLLHYYVFAPVMCVFGRLRTRFFLKLQ